MKTLKEQIKVMQAYVDGKTIKQTVRRNGTVLKITYQEESSPRAFNWADYDYDIVQEPIVKYMIVVSENGSTVCEYDSYEDAKWRLKGIPYDCYKIIKLVQDMDFKGDEE